MSGTTFKRYLSLFADHTSKEIKALRPWQQDVLAQFAELGQEDAAIESPTGSGKTLLALLLAEDHRLQSEESVVYLAGTKQLARQVERQAKNLHIPVVRFQGSKNLWSQSDLQSAEWGQAIAVTNYWAYFNESPGLSPASFLVLDDVHLVESVIRGFFTCEIARGSELFEQLLRLIVSRFPYYSVATDLLNGIEQPGPPEMMAFVDSAELEPEMSELIDQGLGEGTDPWWGWRRIRANAAVCCWLISRRGITVTPFLPPTQTIDHFAKPERRLYLSATVGTVDDVQRRVGCRPFKKLTALTPPQQGKRLVVFPDLGETSNFAAAVVEMSGFLKEQKKAVWLCARNDTADTVESLLRGMGTPGEVRRLVADNGEDEVFMSSDAGQLVTAGRFDGLDFPGDTCRVEILPEAPVATSDLEEFVSSYLRDAEFASARFAQRIAQALGRCNRDENDRAAYLLLDPEIRTRLSRKDVVATLPKDVRHDVAAGLLSHDSLEDALDTVSAFLEGKEPPKTKVPKFKPAPSPAETGGAEVEIILDLWSEQYQAAADRVESMLAALPPGSREYRAYWIALKALALQRAADAFGDRAARRQTRRTLKSAIDVGGRNTYFARMRAALARAEGEPTFVPGAEFDQLFAAWDALIERYGTHGPRFQTWADRLTDELTSDNHDSVVGAIRSLGSELLGIAAEAPKATSGECDVIWRAGGDKPRFLAFEVKLSPSAKKITNKDVEQAEGAVRALEAKSNADVIGLIVTPHHDIQKTAIDRLERCALVECEKLKSYTQRLVELLTEYRRGWSDDAGIRLERRAAVESELPTVDALWVAAASAKPWLELGDL